MKDREPTEEEEKRNFRRVLCIVLGAHVGLACIPLGWVRWSNSTRDMTGIAKQEMERIEWLEPIVVADSRNESDALVARVVSRTPLMDETRLAAEMQVPPVEDSELAATDFGISEDGSRPLVETGDQESPTFTINTAPKPSPTPASRNFNAVNKRGRLTKSGFHPTISAPEETPGSELVSTPPSQPQTTENVSPAARPGPAEDSETSQNQKDAISAYHDRIQRLMERNWAQPKEAASGTPAARVALTIARNGTVSEARLSMSSGNEAVDRSAMNAVRSVPMIDPLPTAIRSDSYQLIIKFVLH